MQERLSEVRPSMSHHLRWETKLPGTSLSTLPGNVESASLKLPVGGQVRWWVLATRAYGEQQTERPIRGAD